MSRFLIIGAGISGCSAAYELAQEGHEIEVLDCASAVGGKVLSYCCKATTACSRCGVCVAHTRLSEALYHPRIHFSLGVSVEEATRSYGEITVRVRRANPSIDYRRCIRCNACLRACPTGCIGVYSRAELVQYPVDYSRCLLHQGKPCAACSRACPTAAITAGSPSTDLDLSAAAVLIASGHQPYDARRKLRLGYGRIPNVLTAVEAEMILSRQSFLGRPGGSVAFVQCVGSRDPKEGRNYCSSVCCAYALRLARLLKHRSPEAEVTVYTIDLQNFDKAFSLLREELVSSSIHFIRGVPYSVEQVMGDLSRGASAAGSPVLQGKLRLRVESPQGGESVVEHDTVVLSVGMGPAAGSARLAEIFGLEADVFGFFSRGSGEAGSGIVTAGTCREPQSITDSMASARAAALEMGRGL